VRRHVNRAYVARLLEDDSLSYREIARRASCSDYSVRAIAAQLRDGCGSMTEPPPQRRVRPARDPDDYPEIEYEPLSGTAWAVIAGIAIVIFGAMWITSSRLPPTDYGTM
jgi:hypothetical protein